MMPPEIQSLYRCLLVRGDEVFSCDQKVLNEYHVMIVTNVVHTEEVTMIFVQLSPTLTGDGWNSDSIK